MVTTTPLSANTRTTPTACDSSPPGLPRRSRITASCLRAARAAISRTFVAAVAGKLSSRIMHTFVPCERITRLAMYGSVMGRRTSVSDMGSRRPVRMISRCIAEPTRPPIRSSARR